MRARSVFINLLWAGCCLLVMTSAGLAQEPQWPNVIQKNGSTLLTYQPQVDEWPNYTDLHWRAAFSVTPPGGKAVIGVEVGECQTEVIRERDLVLMSNIQIKKFYFPSLDDATSAQMEQLVRSLMPPTAAISLHRLVACVPKPASVPGVQLRNDPPPIFVSYRPAILLFVDGNPEMAAVKDTTLEFVANTSWPLFHDKSTGAYLLLVGQEWMTAGSLQGPWSTTKQLPAGMAKVAQDKEWASLKSVIPPPAVKPVSPTVYYTLTPAEVLLFDGQPALTAIPGTSLQYAANTASDVFFYVRTQQYYILTSGRWFRSNSLNGPWSYASNDMPIDFAMIPPNNPAGRVLASVPGTEESKDAVLLAQVPTTMTVDPAAAAAKAKVEYSGEPTFAPIEGTTLSYATNTADKVIQVGDVYYLCLQGVWFMSTTAQGPWTTASSVPQVIYTIPPSSPVYNVTYVTQTVTAGIYTSSYTAGYMGAFIVGATVGAIVASGSGYYYPPYMYHPPYGYPIYHPYPATYGSVHYYGTSTGAYGVSQTAYGAYGSATRTASYNPYTGTYARTASASTAYGSAGAAKTYNPYTGTAARGATVSTPYGSRSAAQAYNPYTGRYGATSQGSSPGAQWGSSVVSNGNKSAATQHYSTSQGTVGSAQTSSGGKMVGASGANGNSGSMAKSSSGDMYASKDGNAYKNTGSGWQKYDNGSWNSVSKPTSASGAQASAARSSAASSGYHPSGGSAETQQLDQERANRDRGASGGGSRSYGGGGYGGGRRR